MEINSSLASRLYSTARSATRPEPATRQTGQPTGLAGATADFVQTLREGEETAKAALTGKADMSALVESLAKTELAVETAATIRNKVVEAYQEILRMPV
ncbi:MAG: flagellar hook-basal body complex protein FliE [Paracoccaceae bacterium]